MSTQPKDTSGEKPLRVRRGRVDSVDLYEIKDSELDLLEKGSPVSIYLNFSIFLFSIAFSALAVLCTAATFKHTVAQTIFIVVMVVGFLMGGFLLILWYRGHSSVSEVIDEIRNRIPPEQKSAAIADSSPESPGEEEQMPPQPRG